MLPLQIISLMRVAPLTEDDSLGKAALFTKYVEALPHALDSWKVKGLGLVTNLLSGMHRAVQQNTVVHQNLFRCAMLLALWQTALLHCQHSRDCSM